ncbi:hypothetical protein MATL_G00218200 [Megalops atlanticus]|uniref:Uncharacterized protein n=1 Tax=Megalops atlanticus TaxID=7932 RepID=A0A9D3PH77_MEGAT|nr:hypothetical protein MATL_G00218200 [Megalops atlanticus]
MSNENFIEIPQFLSSDKKTILCATYLRRCSYVWIVNDIDRAASDKDPWTMLNSSIQNMRQGGECRNITFICTKTDIINPQSYMRSSRIRDKDLSGGQVLDTAGKKRACILHRNEQAKKVVRNSFNHETEIKKHFKEDVFQVFTVSSEEFLSEENPILKSSETEIPQVRELLRKLNRDCLKKAEDCYVSRVFGILSLIHGENCGSNEMDKEKLEVYQILKTKLEEECKKMSSFLSLVYEDFDQCLSNGAVKSENLCVKHALDQVIAPTSRTMHYNTLKAVCRRDGFFISGDGTVINMNRSLATAMFEHVDDLFQSIFPKTYSSSS